MFSEDHAAEVTRLISAHGYDRHAPAVNPHAGRGPGSLHSAAVLASSGHGDVAGARALIKKAAAHFGVDLRSLPGFSQDDEDLKERAERDRKRKGQHSYVR
jgi:hypothetical protein